MLYSTLAFSLRTASLDLLSKWQLHARLLVQCQRLP
jgi:hypothetical protein